MVDERFRGVEAVFFDLDDTLCGYWDAAKAGLAEAFRQHPVAGKSPTEMVQEWAEAFRGFSPLIKTSEWYPRYLKTGDASRVEQMRRTLERMGIEDLEWATRLAKAYATERDKALKLFPGALEMLQKIHAKYPMGLITNGPADTQRQEVQTLDIGQYFKWIYIEGEMGEGKPEARVFLRAAEKAGLQPSQLVFVGNSYKHDMRPALEAGWKTIWVRRPTDVPPSADPKAKPEGRPEGSVAPDAEVREMAEIAELLL